MPVDKRHRSIKLHLSVTLKSSMNEIQGLLKLLTLSKWNTVKAMRMRKVDPSIPTLHAADKKPFTIIFPYFNFASSNKLAFYTTPLYIRRETQRISLLNVYTNRCDVVGIILCTNLKVSCYRQTENNLVSLPELKAAVIKNAISRLIKRQISGDSFRHLLWACTNFPGQLLSGWLPLSREVPFEFTKIEIVKIPNFLVKSLQEGLKGAVHQNFPRFFRELRLNYRPYKGTLANVQSDFWTTILNKVVNLFS